VRFIPLRFCLLPFFSSLLLSTVRADENYFGYSFGSETLPKGKWELYSWTTGRFGKGTGSYSAFDLKQEVEYGVTDRLQIALEWKENHTYFTGGAGQESADSNTPARRNRFSFVGNGLELKYAFSSPYKDPVGIALFVEPEYALTDSPSGDKFLEWEIETRLLVQKNFSEDRLIAVLNLTNETEWERPRPSHGESFTTNFKHHGVELPFRAELVCWSRDSLRHPVGEREYSQSSGLGIFDRSGASLCGRPMVGDSNLVAPGSRLARGRISVRFFGLEQPRTERGSAKDRL
jgi:hypothetical protein